MWDHAVPCTTGQERGSAKKRQGCSRIEHSIFLPSLGEPSLHPQVLGDAKAYGQLCSGCNPVLLPVTNFSPPAHNSRNLGLLGIKFKTWFLIGFCLVVSFDANSDKAFGTLWRREVEIRKQCWAFPRQTRESKAAQSRVGSSTHSYRMGYSALGGHYGEKGCCLSNHHHLAHLDQYLIPSSVLCTCKGTPSKSWPRCLFLHCQEGTFQGRICKVVTLLHAFSEVWSSKYSSIWALT